MTDLDELERLLREATVGPVVWRGEYAVQKMMHAINDEEWKLFCALRNAAKELIRDARRYRWLTHCGAFTAGRATSAPWGLHLSGTATNPADLDAAIDAAIAKGGE